MDPIYAKMNHESLKPQFGQRTDSRAQKSFLRHSGATLDSIFDFRSSQLFHRFYMFDIFSFKKSAVGPQKFLRVQNFLSKIVFQVFLNRFSFCFITIGQKATTLRSTFVSKLFEHNLDLGTPN